MRQLQRHVPRPLLPLACGLVAALAAGAARAQPAAPPIGKSLEVQLFQSAIGPWRYLTLDSARVPAHKLFSVGLMFNYQKSPASLYTVNINNQLTERVSIVDKQFAGELTAAVGLLDRVQVGFALPMTFLLDGDDFDTSGAATGRTLSGAGLGDLRVEGKYQLTRASLGEDGEDGDVYLAVVGGLTAPTGDSKRFLGDKTLTGRVKLVSEYVADNFRAGGMLGVLLRDTTQTFAARVGHQLMYAVAAEYRVHRQIGLLAEWFGRNGFSNYVDEAPMEIDGAVQVHATSMLSLVFGAGTGLIQGIGSPRFRGFLGASFNPDFRDSDGDGVYDLDDRCPDEREDRDGYKDSDGCPEPDNDGDGILDVEDKCPNDPEDFDQFEDEDGCPEPDNDGDGIPDLNDPCPNAAEDGQGKRPNDGCPSSIEDSDGDGVPDAKDRCPDEPEDRDGFEDEDGCPELDNDGDGIPDQFDTCPNTPEDADGFEDEDGCPEPDNDKDGFLDAEDKCPNEAEVYNANKDDDGCPDPGAPWVVVSDGAIELRERVAFQGSGLRPQGEQLVKMVARLLQGHPEFAVVRIEVAAGTQSEASARGEAIKQVLVAAGVNPARLKVTGRVARADAQFVVESVVDANPAGR